MPLHGKIVVIKRSGGDGTEFPLTATCLFGRKPDCDIRIQLPQVSKEHCRIDLNENKEVILTNLSSVNPTRVNGDILQQTERLKHGDVITIIDRSFRFEYPPAPTPKKRSSIGKTEKFKVLQDQQAGDTVTTETKEKRIVEVSKDPHLKDGTNHDNIQRSLENAVEVESKKDDDLQNKTTSPFNDLYQMIKQSLDVKTPRKSCASLLQTPASRFCTPKPGSVKKNGGNPVISTEDKSTQKKADANVHSGAAETKKKVEMSEIPVSDKNQRGSFSTEIGRPEAENAVKTEATSPQKKEHATPQRFTVCEVIEQVCAQTSKSPLRRRSKEATPDKPAAPKEQKKQTTTRSVKESPSNSGKAEKVKRMSQKRKSGELAADLTTQQIKKKRVSFGGQLSPELFDKRLPPDSPLRKGGTPRRSFCLLKTRQSLLRRASAIGLMQEHPDSPNVRSPATKRTPSPKKSSSPKNASPKTPSSAKASPKSRPSSPKTPVPSKKSPKASTPSPKTSTPGKKSPVSKKLSPKAASPGKKSPKSMPLSPKAVTPGEKLTKARTPSPKTVTPGKKSPKSQSPSPKKLTKARTPSPKSVTPSKKSPKSQGPSPKTVTPGKKLTKDRTPSPKAVTPGKKSPKSPSPSPKAVTPRKKTPKPRTPSPKAASPATRSSESKIPTRGRSPSRNKAEVQQTPGDQTPIVRGRFSVSLICTPSPIVEHAVTGQVPLVTATPKIPLRRKSMKSTSRKTPSVRKSAVKAMCRRSGKSRASMKALSSWANIVKFGQTKPQMAAPVKKVVPIKMRKKAVPKPQTPARKLKDHASTGHVDSPVTIVVGRAHQQKVVHSTGAAPRLITNTAFLKKSMKMNEDLTGISEMFKTPVAERKRRSVVNDSSAMKTPLGGLETSVIDPSVLNTPEEPGEMTVSPLSVSSTVKDKNYNSEAVQRLLDEDQESSFLGDIPPAVETVSISSEEQCTDLKTTSAPTPKQKPRLPDCLTGVKRIMKTPKQKAEPVEDLRGKLLKTPKQKLEQQECLTGVKRIMKTPRQKAEPVEDLRGKLLKTPKQTLEQQECLTGVKRIMKTPRQKAEPVEDLRGNLLKTPKQKLEEQECLTGVKRIFETPRQEAEPHQDLQGNLLETPGALDAADVSRDGAEEMAATSTCMQESEGVAETTETSDSDMKSSPSECLTGVKRLMKTPKVRNTPVDDLAGVKRLMKTPREKAEPVEDNFGIEGLLKSPRLGINPMEDVDGLKEPMEEPLADPPGQLETNEAYNQTPVDCGGDIAKELDFTLEEPQDAVPSDGIDNVQVDVDVEKQAGANEVDGDDHLEEGPSGHENVESSDAMKTISQAAVDENLPVEDTKVEMAEVEFSDGPKVDTVDETVSEEQPKMETAAGKGTEVETATDPDQVTEVETAEDPDQVTEVETAADPDQVTEIETAADPDQVTEIETAADPDHGKNSTRSRRGKTLESALAENTQEAQVHSEDPVVSAPVRGRRGRKNETAAPPAVRQTSRRRNAKAAESSSVELSTEENVSLVPNVARKPARGRNAKKASDDKVEAEMAQEISSEKLSESANDHITPVDVNHKENDSAAPPEKPKRGRKTNRPEKSVPEQQAVPCDVVLPADTAKEVDANIVSSGQMQVSSTGSDENEPDAMKAVPQVPATEILPEVETATCKVTEMDAAIVPKKSVRGRKAKVVQSKSSEDKEEVTEHSEGPAVPAPVRGRRGKKAEATALPAVRQTRSRNAKSQESSSSYQSEMAAEKAVETTQVTEIITEAANDQTPPVTTHQEENISAPHAKETNMKPKRGRKTKTPVEPEKKEVVSDEQPLTDAPPQKSIPSLVKPRRGRKAALDAVEQSEAAEETVLTAEPEQQTQPPVRARRGRNVKVEEVKLETNNPTSVEILKSTEQVKTSRRTKKAEQDHVEPKEIQTVQSAVPQKAEVLPVAQPVMNEQAVTATRTTRGRKSKQVPEVPAASSTDKPKRGRRGKPVSDEVPAVIPEEKASTELETEEKSNEVDPPVIKSSRARGLKNEVSLAIPAKRARRGVAPSHETSAESAVLISGKRGRQTAAKSVKENDMVSCDQVNPTEDLSNEDAQKSVKWKKDIEVFEILTVTPKAVRGRKPKLGDRVDAESQIVSKNVSKTEEKDLSDTVAEALPAKRARRGSKMVDETSDKAKSTSSVRSVEAETQPKTRRGRSAKK